MKTLLMVIFLLSVPLCATDSACAREIAELSQQVTGTVLLYTKTRLQITYREAGIERISIFQIDKKTKFTGVVKKGSLVEVTYRKKRFHRRHLRKIVSEIKVLPFMIEKQ